MTLWEGDSQTRRREKCVQRHHTIKALREGCRAFIYKLHCRVNEGINSQRLPSHQVGGCLDGEALAKCTGYEDLKATVRQPSSGSWHEFRRSWETGECEAKRALRAVRISDRDLVCSASARVE